MKNQPEIVQDEMKEEGKAAASIAEAEVCDSLVLLKNQPGITQDDMKAKQKAAAAIAEVEICSHTLVLMKNQPEITQDEMKAEENAAAAIAEAEACDSLVLLKNQPGITQDDMKAKQKAAAAIAEVEICSHTLVLMKNQPEITQDEMKAEENAAAAIAEAEACDSLVLLKNQPGITQDDIKAKQKAAAAIAEVEICSHSLLLMKNQSEITQDEMRAEEKAAAAVAEGEICDSVIFMKSQPEITQDEMRKAKEKVAAAIAEAKALMLIRPSTSKPGIPFLSRNLGSLVHILGLGRLSSTNVASIDDNDRQTFISIHNRALYKFSRIASGEYFCMSDRSEEFDGVQIRYKHLGQRRDLVVVSFTDLEIGEPNELRVLYGELCVDPFKFGRIFTVLKESNTENCIALSVVAPTFLCTDQTYAKNAYPKGTKIALMQPRLVKSKDGFKWLDVDNPRSIVRIETFPERSPTKFHDWFSKGGRAHDAEEWEACVRNYTKCEIILSETKSFAYNLQPLRFKLYSNRSQAYIALGRYQDAYEDAMTCSDIDSSYLDSSPEIRLQGLRMLIESHVSLGRYKEAYLWVDDRLTCHPSKESKELLYFYWQKSIEYYRMGEGMVGIAESPNNCKPDADFIGPVEMKISENGNTRGIFATDFVKAGTVLLICRALATCDDYSYPFMHTPMANGLIQNVENALNQKEDEVRLFFLSLDPSNSSLFKISVSTLHGLAMGRVESPNTPRIMLIRRKYEKLQTAGILRILKTIAFDDISPENRDQDWTNLAEKRRYYGVWLIPSLINHSCLPNASRINVDDVMSIHATKDINEGEEITIPYFDVLLPYHVRQAASRKWGFTCACERCELERNIVSLDVHKRIYEKFYSASLQAGISNTKAHSGKSSIDVDAMAKFSEELDGWLESLGEMLGEVNSMWIRSSFIIFYLARLRINLAECYRLKYKKMVYRKYLNNLTIVQGAMLATCPGDIRHLLLDLRNLETYRLIVAIHPDYEGFYERIFDVKKSFDCVYGCQKPKIVKVILRKLSKSSIF